LQSNSTWKKIAEADVKEVEDEIKKFKAICFLLHANKSRYGGLLGDLKKAFFPQNRICHIQATIQNLTSDQA